MQKVEQKKFKFFHDKDKDGRSAEMFEFSIGADKPSDNIFLRLSTYNFTYDQTKILSHELSKVLGNVKSPAKRLLTMFEQNDIKCSCTDKSCDLCFLKSLVE